MKEKTKEPKPLVILEAKKKDAPRTEIYVLDEGDSMAWNTSTQYDHHMKGPSIVIKQNHVNGTNLNETYVNDPQIWIWVNALARLGGEYLNEHPDFDFDKLVKDIAEEYETREPHKSIHKK